MGDEKCVVVVAICEGDVLICKTASYVQDHLKYVSGQSIYEFQRVYTLGENAAGAGAGQQRIVENTPQDIAAATEIFKQRMAQIPAEYRKQLSFMTPTWKPKDKDGEIRISTKFKFNKADKNPGFIKGTFPDPKNPKDTLQVAAKREFKEETGIDYPLDNFVEVPGTKNKNIFKLIVPPDRKEEIIKSWQSIPHEENELVELYWKNTDSICSMKINSQCEEAAKLVTFGEICGQSASTMSSYSPSTGQSASTTSSQFPSPAQGETLESYVNRAPTSAARALYRNQARRLGLKGGRTIRQKKSRRSKKRGTLKKVHRR